MDCLNVVSKKARAAFASGIIFSLLFTACNQPIGPAVAIAVKPAIEQAAVAIDLSTDQKARKKIYITFDDGPNKGTNNVLDIIKDEQVPVTFFVVGEHVYASKVQSKMWDSLRSMKHVEICNHSYTHGHNNRYDKFYKSPKIVISDFKRTSDSLRLNNNIVRTPGRNIWRVDHINYTDFNTSKAAADNLEKAGFVVMGWDLEWHYDHKTMTVKASADEMIQRIDSAFAKKKLMQKDHLVLLAHDQVYAKSSDSLELRKFFQMLKRKNEYELAFVTSYPAINKKGRG